MTIPCDVEFHIMIPEDADAITCIVFTSLGLFCAGVSTRWDCAGEPGCVLPLLPLG